jgi:hypothetical protein
VKWQRLTAWAEVSADGRYSVASVKVHGRFYHEAWKRPTETDKLRELLATCNEVQDARGVCEKHASAHPASVAQELK